MKKIISLLALLIMPLFAQEASFVIKYYSTDENISIEKIAQWSSQFEIQDSEFQEEVQFEILLNSEDIETLKQNTNHKFNWIMIEFDENLSQGNYWVEYKAFEFTKSTLIPHQWVEKFSFLGRKFFSFYYNKNKNPRQYFFQLALNTSHVAPIISLYSLKELSQWVERYGLKLIISFFLFGVIFMTAFYNGALYLFNRKKSFLFYMLMQFFMLGVLFYNTDIINGYIMGDVENEEIAIFFYFLLVNCAIIFILYFIRSFLETKIYLPKQEKILRYITIFAFIDLLLFFVPFMLILRLYTFIGLYIVWVAWLRLRQGYKPALFFLFGWFSFSVGTLLSEYFEDSFAFDTLLLGSTFEALFLALAISYQISLIKKSKEEQQELLVHQSRLASMGEMLGNIAHQWRQPLSRLAYILMNIEVKDRKNLHEKKLNEANEQLEFMSQTIDDFRNFYKSDKQKEQFSLVHESQKVLDFISFEEVEIELKAVEEQTIINYKNEYKQVLLNIINNAKDVLIQRKIKSPKIIIEIKGTRVTISDNAGGIHLPNIEKIFEPYFTTKEQGMGIGLYMSKTIIEHNMGGKLEVSNGKKGAVFVLSMP